MGREDNEREPMTENNIETSIFAEINRLRAENERLRKALKNVLDDGFGQRSAFTNVRSISVGTLIAVREALGETDG